MYFQKAYKGLHKSDLKLLKLELRKKKDAIFVELNSCKFYIVGKYFAFFKLLSHIVY